MYMWQKNQETWLNSLFFSRHGQIPAKRQFEEEGSPPVPSSFEDMVHHDGKGMAAGVCDSSHIVSHSESGE